MTNSLLLIACTAAGTLLAKYLWDNRRSVREKQRLLTLWTGFSYAWDHAKLGTDRSVAWRMLTQTEPGAAPQTPEL